METGRICVFKNNVHLLVSVPPKLVVANLVGKLKGKSAYFLRKECWPDLKKSFGGNTYGRPVTVLLAVEVRR